MRSKARKFIFFLSGYILLPAALFAQDFSFNCARDTTIAGCSFNSCLTIKTLIPDIHGNTGAYTINPVAAVAGGCSPVYVDPASAGTTANLSEDDKYSSVIPIGFPFPFFGTTYNSVVVSSNGVVSFDVTKASASAEYGIILDGQGGLSASDIGPGVDLPSNLYDRAVIMGAYQDLNINIPESPNKHIQYTTIGTAPNRKWVLSFYKVPLFNNPAGVTPACGILIENTQQITLYESTGIVEVRIFSKQVCPGWNQGRAMIGIQNFTRDMAFMPPGRKASDPPWGDVNMNESWRFVPAKGPSLLKRVELYDLGGNLLQTMTTPTDLGNGKLEASFDICPMPAPSTTTTYVVRSVYTRIDDATAEVYGADTIHVTRTAAPDLHPSVVMTTADCGTANGALTVNIPNGAGTAPFQYALDLGLPGPGNFFNGLQAGMHTVHIQDAGGCSGSIPVTINSVGVLDVNYVAVNTSCTGVNNGSITVTPPAGTAPIEYSLNNTAYTTNNVFSNLAPGNYTISVRDGGGCSKDNIPVTIAAGAPLTFTATANPPSCAGANNASITLVPASGTAPYSYSINNGTFQPGTTITSLPGNSLNVVVLKDAIGCVSLSQQILIVPGTNSLTGTATSTPATCTGVNNGSIAVMPTSGSGPYDYSINNGTSWQANNIFSGLSAGIYAIKIRENGTCISASIPATITTGAGLQVSAIPTETSCTGVNNGSISITTNGTAPYTFTVNPGGITQTNSTGTAVFANLAAGAYTVLVKDANGCSGATGAVAATIPAGAGFTASTTSTPVSCAGGSNGSLQVKTNNNGVIPYQFVLNATVTQTGTSANFTGLLANPANQVIITDNAGCKVTLSNLAITEPLPISITPVTKSALCNGQGNGTITANVTGGTPDYTYSMDGGAYQSVNQFSVTAGAHKLAVRDANSCTAAYNNISVTEPAVLTASISTLTDASCDGGNDGSATVIATGGTAPYQYSADGSTFQQSNLLKLGPGTYSIVVKDANNCSYTINGVSIVLNNNLTLVPATDPSPICQGTSVKLQVNTNATQFSWTPAATLSNPGIIDPVAAPSSTTLYTVTATLGRCTTTDDISVTVLPAPIPDAGAGGEVCYGQNYQLLGSGGTSYHWTPAAYLNNSSIQDPQVTNATQTITYSLRVTDANNCTSLIADQVTVNVTQPLIVTTVPADTIVYAGDRIQLHAYSAGTRYTWSPAAGLDNPSVANPVATAPTLDGQTVLYHVEVTTGAGCEGSGDVTLHVFRGPEIYVPNAFTPNGDGKNDEFVPVPVGMRKINYFKIFNRWGQMLFSTTTLSQGWDGNSAGAKQPPGAYVWIIEGVTHTGQLITKKGTVILIR